MIGADSKFLLRYILEDDVAETQAVEGLLASARSNREPILVTTIVLCESVWHLRRKSRRRKAAVVAILERLLLSDILVFEHQDLVNSALRQYRDGKGDFADYLIGEVGRSKGCRHTVTFDKELHGAPGFSPVTKR